MGIAEIARAKEAYATTDLRQKLARWHADVDNAFRGWNDAWLDPEFRGWDITEPLAYIRVPILIAQGEDEPLHGVQVGSEAAVADCARVVQPLDAEHAAPHFDDFDAPCDPVRQVTL